MALFGKLFEKKECAICGNEIKLLGNRKLEDGNMCKSCAEKLSPWFSERRTSTVAEIKEQLAYREENRANLASFTTTRTFGKDMKVLVDEDHQKFVVTRARNLEEANPDIIDLAMVTGAELSISETKTEDKKKDAEGKMVSYNPQRYFFSYSLSLLVHVNHPYFDEIRIPITNSSIRINTISVQLSRQPNPRDNATFAEYEKAALEIKEVLTATREKIREDAKPKQAMTCPWCGATTTPTENGTCEYCGGSLV